MNLFILLAAWISIGIISYFIIVHTIRISQTNFGKHPDYPIIDYSILKNKGLFTVHIMLSCIAIFISLTIFIITKMEIYQLNNKKGDYKNLPQ